MFSLKFREAFEGKVGRALLEELDGLMASIQQFLTVEHNPDGSHADINAGTISATSVAISKADPSYALELGVDSAGKPATSTWTVVSDGRAKKNVKTYKGGGLSKLRGLRLVEYEYTGGRGTPRGQKGVGVIAQEARTVMPESVVELPLPKRLQKYAEPGDSTLGWNAHYAIMAMIDAVQELADRVEALEKKHGN